MIVQSTVKQVIEDSIKKLNAINMDYEFAGRDALIDYYTYSNTEKYIVDYFKGSLQKEIPLYTQNMTQRLIKRISMVYKNSPVRKVDNDDYQSIIGTKDYSLKLCERIHNLVGTMAVKVCPDADDNMMYQPIINFEPIFAEGDPLNPVAITYLIEKVRGNSYQVGSEDKFVYWSADEHFIFDTDGKIYPPTEDNPDMVNPYGVLPFVFLQPATQVDEFWNEGASDIANANRQIDIAMTMLQHHIRSAGGQFVISGRVDDSQVEFGLNKAIVLEDGDMQNLNPNLDINGIIEGIKFQLMHVFQNHHVTFEYGITGSKSGIALKIENLELLESREDEVEKWRVAERAIYKVEKAIAETLNINLPDEFAVDFAEVEFPLSVVEEQQRWDWLWSNGIKDKIDYLMENDPDGFRTREDAEEYLAIRQASANTVKNLSDTEDNAFKLNNIGENNDA